MSRSQEGTTGRRESRGGSDAVRFILIGMAIPVLLSALASGDATDPATEPPPTARRRTAVVEVVEDSTPAIVAIEVLARSPGRGDPSATNVGSGVLINARGYLLSNYHVVRGAREVRVRLASGDEYPAALEAVSEASDLALLEIEGGRRHDFPYLRLGSSGDLLPGETVVAIGNPYGFRHTVSTGVVSAVERKVKLPSSGEHADFIQTDAAINPGNSGGALINLDGELVGVNSGILNQGWGLAFAIPVDRVKDLLSGYVRKENAMGLGVDELATGLRIGGIVPGSTAEQAGLQVGDTLLSGNGQPLDRIVDLVVASLGASADRPIRFHVRRADRELAVKVPGVSLLWTRLGLDVVDERGSDAEGRPLPGIRVVNLRPGGPAVTGSLARGDLIYKATLADGDPGESPDFREYRIHKEDDLLIIVERYPEHDLRLECLRDGQPRRCVLRIRP